MKAVKNNCLCLILFICFYTKVTAQCSTWYPFFSSGTYNCVNNTALGTYTINGNSPPITFTIVNAVTGAIFYSGTSTSNTGTFNPIPVGTYNVFGGNAPGCTFSTIFQVVSPISPASISFTASPVSCNGGNNGSASVFASSPFTPPYSYTWTNGSSSQSVSNLSAGTYTAIVKDKVGCIATKSLQIIEPDQINTKFSNTLTACNGGTLTTVITSTGGTGPFNYTVNNISLTGNSVGGIYAGTHTVITKDAKGCLNTNTIIVSQPLPFTMSFTVTKPTCSNSINGAVGITNVPLGYSYMWQPGGAITAGINNIGVGAYTLSVQDGNSCITNSVVNVSALNSMSANVSSKPENCSAADGAFTLNISGGSSPYTYSTISIGTHVNNFLGGLSSGSYATIVTDINNCVDTVKVVIGNLSTVSISIVNSNPVLCYNNCTGSVQVSVVNGVPPLTFSATGNPTTTSGFIKNLCAGLITINVMDNIGCPATTTINFPTPPAFSYSAAAPPSVCVGKTFTLQGDASGGTGVYKYVWNPGNLIGQTVNPVSIASTNYSLNVYDGNGCTLAPFIVSVSVNPLIAINLNNSNSGICPGTTAQITPTISGGDGIYTYNWIPGNITSPSIFVQNVTVPVYTLTVNDACGSPPAIKEVTINLFPVTIPTYSLSSNSGCEPFCTQFINTTIKSTNVIWNYGDRPFEQLGNITNYCYSKYGIFNVRLTVNDSNSCKSVYTYTNAVNVLQKPNTGFVADPATITLNDASNVLIENTTLAGLYYSWYVNGNYLANTKNIQYSFSDTGCVKFRLIAINENNCTDTLDKSICVMEGFNLWVPNCFTPNEDNLNDVFIPKGTGFTDKNYLFEIFNRSGKRIFKTNDIKVGWDGITKDLYDPQNMYYWHITLTDNLERVKNFKGAVLILR